MKKREKIIILEDFKKKKSDKDKKSKDDILKEILERAKKLDW